MKVTYYRQAAYKGLHPSPKCQPALPHIPDQLVLQAVMSNDSIIPEQDSPLVRHMANYHTFHLVILICLYGEILRKVQNLIS